MEMVITTTPYIPDQTTPVSRSSPVQYVVLACGLLYMLLEAIAVKDVKYFVRVIVLWVIVMYAEIS